MYEGGRRIATSTYVLSVFRVPSIACLFATIATRGKETRVKLRNAAQGGVWILRHEAVTTLASFNVGLTLTLSYQNRTRVRTSGYCCCTWCTGTSEARCSRMAMGPRHVVHVEVEVDDNFK